MKILFTDFLLSIWPPAVAVSLVVGAASDLDHFNWIFAITSILASGACGMVLLAWWRKMQIYDQSKRLRFVKISLRLVPLIVFACMVASSPVLHCITFSGQLSREERIIRWAGISVVMVVCLLVSKKAPVATSCLYGSILAYSVFFVDVMVFPLGRHGGDSLITLAFEMVWLYAVAFVFGLVARYVQVIVSKRTVKQ